MSNNDEMAWPHRPRGRRPIHKDRAARDAAYRARKRLREMEDPANIASLARQLARQIVFTRDGGHDLGPSSVTDAWILTLRNIELDALRAAAAAKEPEK